MDEVENFVLAPVENNPKEERKVSAHAEAHEDTDVYSLSTSWIKVEIYPGL